jgi:hypothetical protein
LARSPNHPELVDGNVQVSRSLGIGNRSHGGDTVLVDERSPGPLLGHAAAEWTLDVAAQDLAGAETHEPEEAKLRVSRGPDQQPGSHDVHLPSRPNAARPPLYSTGTSVGASMPIKGQDERNCLPY